MEGTSPLGRGPTFRCRGEAVLAPRSGRSDQARTAPPPESSVLVLNTNWPSTRTFNSCRPFSNSQTYPPVRGRAKIDAIVVGQIFGCAHLPAIGEVGRGAGDSHAQVRADPNSDHVFRDNITGPHTGVEPLGRYVGETVLGRDLHPDVGIVLGEALECGKQNGARGIFGRSQPDGACGFLAQLCDCAQLASISSSWGRYLAATARPPPSCRRCGSCGSAGARRASLPSRAWRG